MSGEKTTSPCSKFQANIFNKSKCQNCFKSRELHLLNDHDMEQAKPIYGGWLCLAPEGTDFDNPMQRSRKWQRRFFILYEHGSLSFALDELPSTLPQGTVNMNLCTDIADAEPRTGQRNALCVITPEQEIFIRGDNKEIINGWSEQLAVYLRTNKQNQKKKRKVEPVTNQEPSPAKMAATHPSFPCAESAAAESGCGRWQEEQRGRGPDKTPFWTVTDSDPPGLEQTPAGNTSTHLRPVSRDSLTLDGPGSFASQVGSLDLAINGSTDPGSNNQLAELEPNNIQISANNKNHNDDRSPTERLLSSEATKKEHEGGTAASRKGRSEARTNKREKLQSCGDTAQLTAPPPQRRAKSLDRRTSDTVMTWKKYWFVLSADSLRYYKDSIAEEASDLEGEIDLTKCFNVSEYQVQRNYGFQIHVEDLKAQLEDSERRRLELEAQLSAAGRYQQQLDPSPSSEADFFPLDTNEKPLNNHTQSLNDTYKETRESLEQQNVIRQEQLTPAPPLIASQHTPEHQTPSIWLHDTDGNLQELGDLLPDCPEAVDTPLLSPASDSTDLLSESEEQTVGLNLDGVITNQQNQQDKEDCQLFPNSETQINNSEYSSSSFILENPAERDDASLSCCVEQHTPPDQVILRRLSQEVELLTSQNEALNQRNQEMLNQLTEADREIERLKAELSSRYTEPHHLPEVEQLGQTHVQDLERELSMREQQLQEAQTLITSLEENLRDTETLLQMGVTTETEETGQEESDCAKKAEGYLLRCFEATEAKLTELERQLDQSELTCRKLRAQNTELKEAEKVYCERAAETEADIRRLNQDLEREKLKEGERNRSVCGEERIQQVIEEMIMRLKALGKLLEVIDRLDFDTIKRSTESEEEEKPAVVSQLKWEEEFWGLLLNEVKVKTSQLSEEKAVDVLLSEVTEHMIVEKQMLLLGHDLLSERDKEKEDLEETYESETLKDLDDVWKSVTASETKKTDDSRKFDFSNQLCEMDKNVMERFRVTTQMKTSLLDEIASSVSTSACDKLRSMADRLSDSRFSEHPGFRFIHSAATEAMYCCHINRLQSTYQRELEETKQRLLTCSLICSDCVDLTEENRELRARLSNLEEQQTSSSAAKTNACCQTEETHLQNTDTELQMGDESAADGIETGNVPETSEETAENESSLSCMEIPLSSGEGHWGIQEISDENTEKNEASRRETDPSEQVLALRRRVEELEEQLSVIAEELKEEFDGKMSSAQTQHEKEMEKLKATCERGFASMEESHVKVVEELQRRHQQEVERLLVERDRLLEEESAATATAIEAIKNAHRLELEREVQKRCRSENITGNTHLEDIYRQHTEELASYQRELEVLSEQYSLKCLENVHLVQAVDAERKALCQCQQENQDLRTRNQELSGHLAAEITRLCSLAKQDALPLSQGMDAYEMEITLRVKESEVQCLKQEITSLKDELQSAQRDKRNITKKYKDMYTELSITRAKAERDIDQLRENLRLVHQALRQTSP
eukprot:superscaffoldBa00003991_g18077